MEKRRYNTGSREKIRTYLMENCDRTVSAGDIDDYMKSTGTPVNLTTIYRFLEKLEEDGEIMRYVSTKGNKSVFQYVAEGSSCSRHLHMKCLKCGKIYHLDCEFMDSIKDHIEEDHGFRLECRNSLLCGYCRECRDDDR